MTKLNDAQWKAIQKQTGTDILSIVMDLTSGRCSAGQTMEKISEHCDAAFLAGAKAERVAVLEIAQQEKQSHLTDGSDDPDYDQGYSEAAQEIERRIKERD